MDRLLVICSISGLRMGIRGMQSRKEDEETDMRRTGEGLEVFRYHVSCDTNKEIFLPYIYCCDELHSIRSPTDPHHQCQLKEHECLYLSIAHDISTIIHWSIIRAVPKDVYTGTGTIISKPALIRC
jgi:hypothetical protein